MLRLGLRRFFSAAAASPTATATATTTASSQAPVGAVVLENLETRWASLSDAAREAHRAKLLEVLRGDWKQLTLEQKKAAMFVAYGSHATKKPSDLPQVIGGTVILAIIGVAFSLFIRSLGKENPRTTTKEWQEASNEYARSKRINPITGVSSEGYKGKGFVE